MELNVILIVLMEFECTFFYETCFPSKAQCFLKFFNLSLKCFLNVSYKFCFTPSPKNGYLQCAQLCLLSFFQISSKLNLFSCRDGVYSLSMILAVCFDVKKNLGVKAFIYLIRLHLLFFSIS